MRLFILISFLLSTTWAFGQNNPHRDPTHNFTVHRLIIVNDQHEMLMIREQHVWATPSFVYHERQYVKESLDSLARAYGLQISDVKLRGQFSYKYDYHPYATLRHYYQAKYVDGEVVVPEGMAEVKWLPIDEAIKINTVTSIKQITEQIMKFPETIWGGAFMVSHVGDEHPTKMVEPFYPLN